MLALEAPDSCRAEPALRASPTPRCDFASTPFYVCRRKRAEWQVAEGHPRRAGCELLRHGRHQRPRGGRGGSGNRIASRVPRRAVAACSCCPPRRQSALDATTVPASPSTCEAHAAIDGARGCSRSPLQVEPRRALPHRRVVVVRRTQPARGVRLVASRPRPARVLQRRASERRTNPARRLFLFPGQGAQFARDGAAACTRHEPVYREHLDRPAREHAAGRTSASDLRQSPALPDASRIERPGHGEQLAQTCAHPAR